MTMEEKVDALIAHYDEGEYFRWTAAILDFGVVTKEFGGEMRLLSFARGIAFAMTGRRADEDPVVTQAFAHELVRAVTLNA